MKQLPEGFLWGGATADFQYEGGRGLLSHDFETDGSMENPRHHNSLLVTFYILFW